MNTKNDAIDAVLGERVHARTLNANIKPLLNKVVA